MNRSTVRSLVGAALLCAALSAGAAPSALAATVSGTYIGKVTLVEAPVAGAFAVNDSFTIHFSYDDTIVDSSPGSSILGLYLNAATASGSIGSYDFSGGSGTVTVAHGVAGASISMSLQGTGGAAVNGFTPGILGFSLSGGPALLSSDALPKSYLPASLFTDGHFAVSFFNPSTLETAAVTGQLTVAATPIPAALPLFLSALGVLGLLGRRRRAQSAA